MRELTIDTPGDRSAREGLSHGSTPETLSHRLRRGRVLVWQLRRGAILAATRFPTHISCAAIYEGPVTSVGRASKTNGILAAAA